MDNETMVQYFEWYLPNDGLWWKRCAAKAENMAALGITQVWLPPAYKGTSQEDVGYGVYDMYDLGEFDQKGTIRTKYGTKEEYIEAINAFHNVGIKVLGDIVLNHRMGGDEFEEVSAVTDDPQNRNEQIGGVQTIRTASRFTFPGRKGKYSSFTWDHSHFTGTDWNEETQTAGQVYRFDGKNWAPDTDSEFGNYDYLMGMDVDYSNKKVIRETRQWLRWYIRETGLDGFRLDAVKHISASFYRDLLSYIRRQTGRPLPAVGEYWSGDRGKLLGYLNSVDNEMSLFDVSLHYNFFTASQAGENYDLRRIFDNTILKERPQNAVTFVDNHDTQLGQSLQSFVEEWFKPHCYAIILLRQEGTPCVFYSDYYGNPIKNFPPVLNLGKLMKLRHFYAYGEQIDYLDDPHLIGWVRQGDAEHEGSGMAVTMSNSEGGSVRMFMGKEHAGKIFSDVMESCTENVTIDDEGWGKFPCESKRVSIWVQPEAFEKLIISD